MKKGKLLMMIFTLIIVSKTTYSQVPKIRDNISKLLFNIPASKERFDIKTILNSSENFYNIEEFNFSGLTGISAGFEENPLMNYLGKQNKLTIYFKGNGGFDQIVLLSNYRASDVKICQEQISSLITTYKALNYKVVENASYDGKNQMIGRGYSLYSSSSSYQKHKSYMSISYTQRNNDGYVLDIHFYPSNLY